MSSDELDDMDKDDTQRSAQDDSAIDQPRDITDDGILKVYQAGPLTVLGFGGMDVPSDFNVAHYRSSILELAGAHQCSKIAFDLTGVQIVPSGILGLWASLNQAEIKVEVFNPSADIVEVLEITRLNEFIDIQEIDVESSEESDDADDATDGEAGEE